MDVGSTLREARERAGFSLQDLATRTRIPIKSLRAIEENDFASVPSGIFVRGFIRSYAQEVGVDPSKAVADYRSMTEPAVGSTPSPKQDVVVVDDLRAPFDPELLTSRPGWGYALIAAALLIGIVSMNRYNASDGTKAAATTVAAANVVAADAAAAAVQAPAATVPAPASDKPDATPVVATTGTGVLLEMRATGLCWVRADVDGQTVVSRLMQPGETQSLTGQKDIVLRVGDPAAFSYSVNGRPGQSLGRPLVPVNVRFGADGQVSTVSVAPTASTTPTPSTAPRASKATPTSPETPSSPETAAPTETPASTAPTASTTPTEP